SLTVRFRGLFDRLADARIGAAATDISRHRVIDIGVGGVWVGRQQRRSRHDLARLAVAALWNLPVEPGFLDLGTRRGGGDRFDCPDLGVTNAVDRRDAGTGGSAVDVHCAGTAQRHAAAEFRAGHTEHVAQYPEQRSVVVDIDVVCVAVDFDGEGHDELSYPNSLRQR